MKAQNDVRVTFRVEKDLKDHADILFDRLGMNMSTALNVFLKKTVEESAIPFIIGTKNIGFIPGYSVDEVKNAFTVAVEERIAENKQNGFPIARYDADQNQAYLENPDGTREYING